MSSRMIVQQTTVSPDLERMIKTSTEKKKKKKKDEQYSKSDDNTSNRAMSRRRKWHKTRRENITNEDLEAVDTNLFINRNSFRRRRTIPGSQQISPETIMRRESSQILKRRVFKRFNDNKSSTRSLTSSDKDYSKASTSSERSLLSAKHHHRSCGRRNSTNERLSLSNHTSSHTAGTAELSYSSYESTSPVPNITRRTRGGHNTRRLSPKPSRRSSLKTSGSSKKVFESNVSVLTSNQKEAFSASLAELFDDDWDGFELEEKVRKPKSDSAFVYETPKSPGAVKKTFKVVSRSHLMYESQTGREEKQIEGPSAPGAVALQRRQKMWEQLLASKSSPQRLKRNWTVLD